MSTEQTAAEIHADLVTKKQRLERFQAEVRELPLTPSGLRAREHAKEAAFAFWQLCRYWNLDPEDISDKPVAIVEPTSDWSDQ